MLRLRLRLVFDLLELLLVVEKAEGQVPGLDPKFDCIGGLLAHDPVDVGQTCLVLEQLFLAFELPLEIGDAHLLMMVVLYIYP